MSESMPFSRNEAVIRELAERYPQLYLAPGEEGKKHYRDVVLCGEPVPAKDLSHFHTSLIDESRMVDTPAGEVRVVTLGDRADFVTFLQIIVYRCDPVEIPRTQGASFLNGVISRGKILDHKKQFFRAAREKSGEEPDEEEWLAEQKTFLSDKRNYTDALLVLSRGPYSAVLADAFGFSEGKWLDDSNTIRLYHECTHFVCYRLHPGERDAVRDELVADAVGIVAAYGHYDRKMAERFLGIHDGNYAGGRLENYTDSPGQMLPAVGRMLEKIEKIAGERADMAPLELALLLDEEV